MAADPKRLRNKPFKPKQFFIGVNQPKKVKQTWQEQRKMFELAFGKVKP